MQKPRIITSLLATAIALTMLSTAALPVYAAEHGIGRYTQRPYKSFGTVALTNNTSISTPAELDAALAAAADGDTIALAADITYTHEIEIDGITINFDLGKFNLTIDTTDDFGLYIHSGGKLIQSGSEGKFIINARTDAVRTNGEDTAVNINVDINSATGDGIGAGDGARVTATGNISGATFGINAFNGGVVTFAGSMTANDDGIVARDGGTVTVNGNIMGIGAVIASGGATVTVNGDIIADKTGIHARDDGTNVTVNGYITSDTGISAGTGATVTVCGAIRAKTAEEYIVIDNNAGGYVFFTEKDTNTTKPGYAGYTHSDGTTVWVQNTTTPATTNATTSQSPATATATPETPPPSAPPPQQTQTGAIIPQTGGAGINPMLWIIFAAFVIIVLMVLFILWRKKA